MFQKPLRNKSTENSSHEYKTIVSLLGSGCHFYGDVFLEADFRIAGKLEGKIVSSACVIVEEGAVVIGEISAKNAEILGYVKGNITTDEVIKIFHSANIFGEIKASRIIVDDGAKIEGRIMNSDQSMRTHEEGYV